MDCHLVDLASNITQSYFYSSSDIASSRFPSSSCPRAPLQSILQGKCIPNRRGLFDLIVRSNPYSASEIPHASKPF